MTAQRIAFEPALTERTRIKRVGIPADLHKWIKIRAATEGMTIEEVVVWLINEARARLEG